MSSKTVQSINFTITPSGVLADRDLNWLPDLNIYIIDNEPDEKKIWEIIEKTLTQNQKSFDEKIDNHVDTKVKPENKHDILYNELMNFWSNQSLLFSIDLVENNLFHWRVSYDSKKPIENKTHETEIIQFELIFEKMYPDFPVYIKFIQPKLDHDTILKFTNMSIKNSIAYIINLIIYTVCTSCTFNTTTITEDERNIYELIFLVQIDAKLSSKYSKLHREKIDTVLEKINKIPLSFCENITDYIENSLDNLVAKNASYDEFYIVFELLIKILSDEECLEKFLKIENNIAKILNIIDDSDEKFATAIKYFFEKMKTTKTILEGVDILNNCYGFSQELTKCEYISNPKRLIRIKKELMAIQDMYDDNIHCKFDSNNINVLRVLISSSRDIKNPYSYCHFIFDIMLMPSFPYSAPKFKLLNGNNKKFNKYIDETGTLCFPLINNDWRDDISLVSILREIKSQVFAYEKHHQKMVIKGFWNVTINEKNMKTQNIIMSIECGIKNILEMMKYYPYFESIIKHKIIRDLSDIEIKIKIAHINAEFMSKRKLDSLRNNIIDLYKKNSVVYRYFQSDRSY